LIAASYLATLHSPLFYSSVEGVQISADSILGSTAFTYSIAYNLGFLKKKYFTFGDEAIEYEYKELADVDLFVSDGKPLTVEFMDETFKSTEYLSERSLTVTIPSKSTGDMGRFKRSDPKMGSDAPVSISKVRRYIGLAPGSTFELTVWSNEILPDDLFLTLGIRRSGELRLKKIKPANRNHLNLFMLKEVYNIREKPTDKLQVSLFDVYNNSTGFSRGSDFRKQHFLNVDFKFTNEKLVPAIFRKLRQ